MKVLIRIGIAGLGQETSAELVNINRGMGDSNNNIGMYARANFHVSRHSCLVSVSLAETGEGESELEMVLIRAFQPLSVYTRFCSP